MKGDDPNDILRRYAAFSRQVGTVAGTLAVKWFKSSFANQGFNNTGTAERWKARNPRAKRNKGRAILVDSGRLRRSIRIVQKGPNWAVVGTDVPYAEAHNAGFTGTAAVNVKTFRRKSRKGNIHQVNSHTRTANINIPRRQFLGTSEALNAEIARELVKRLQRLGF